MKAITATIYFCLMAAPANATPPQQTFVPVTIDTAAAQEWVPFDWSSHGVIAVGVMLNGIPAIALIDTGFPDYAVSRRFALAHNIPLSSGGTEYDVGGVAHFDIAESMAMSVAGVHQAPRAMRVSDLSSVEEVLGTPIDIIIGISALSRMSLEVDFDRHELRLRESGAGALPGKVVPVTFDAAIGRVTVKAAYAGHALAPILIDTGAVDQVTLGATSFDAVKNDIGLISDLQSVGAGGTVLEPVFMLHKFMLEDVMFDEITATAESKGGFLSHAGMAGALNLGALSRFNFQLDVGRGTLTLSHRASPDPQTSHSTVGVQWRAMADRLSIVHVMLGSPAASLGLKDGDQICSINGQPINQQWVDSPMGHWGTVPAGVHYEIKLCQGRTVNLKTSDFY